MNEITMVLNDVEVFFLERALKWRIQNIDYFIEKKQLEGLRKANQLSEKATLVGILDSIKELRPEASNSENPTSNEEIKEEEP